MKPGCYAVWVGLAVLLRLLFMPISLHGDLLFVHYFPHFLSYHGVWDIYGYFGDHYISHYGYAYYAPLVYYLTAFFQWILQGLNPGFGELMDWVHGLFYSYQAIEPARLLAAFPRPRVFQWIFWMKAPYLAADALCVWAISAIYSKNPVRLRALGLWLLHPVLLFSIYIFGQYRLFTAFFLWLVIFFVGRGRKTAAFTAYGSLLLLDNFPWILLPPSVLLLGRDFRERLKLLLAALAPFVLVFVPLYVSSEGCVRFSYISPIFNKAAFQSLTLNFAPREVTLACKAILAVLYGGILLGLARKSPASASDFDPQKARDLFVRVNAFVMLAFYATSQTLVQYFMWILPLFVVIQAEKEPWRPSLSWILVALLFLFNLDSRRLNMGLFSPVLGEAALDYPGLHEIMDRFLPWGKVIASARFLFSGLCFYFCYRLYHSRLRAVLSFRFWQRS